MEKRGEVKLQKRKKNERENFPEWKRKHVIKIQREEIPNNKKITNKIRQIWEENKNMQNLLKRR